MHWTIARKFGALYLACLAATVLVVSLSVTGAQRLGGGLRAIDDTAFPAFRESTRLKNSFERIARGYEDAAVTAEDAFLQKCSEEQRIFIEHLNTLRAILGGEWDHAYAELYVAFSDYTVRAHRLAAALMVGGPLRQLSPEEIEDLGQAVQRARLHIHLQLDERVNEAARQVSRRLEEHSLQVARRSDQILYLSIAAGVLLTALAAVLLVRLVLPLRSLQQRMAQVAQGKLSIAEPVGVRFRDELGGLGRGLLDMVAGIRRQTVSRDYLEQILGSLADPQILVAVDGSVVSINQALVDLLGVVEGEILQRPIERLLDLDDWNRIYTDVIRRDRRLHGVDMALFTRDGGSIPVAVSASPVRVTEGDRQVLILARDLREAYKSRHDLVEAHRRAQQAVAARDRFLEHLQCGVGRRLAAATDAGRQGAESERIAAITADAEGLLADLIDLVQAQEGLQHPLTFFVELAALLRTWAGSAPWAESLAAVTIDLPDGRARLPHHLLLRLLECLLVTALRDCGDAVRPELRIAYDEAGDDSCLLVEVQAIGGRLPGGIARLVSLGRPQELPPGDERFHTVLRLMLARLLAEQAGGTLATDARGEDGLRWRVVLPAMIERRDDDGDTPAAAIACVAVGDDAIWRCTRMQWQALGWPIAHLPTVAAAQAWLSASGRSCGLVVVGADWSDTPESELEGPWPVQRCSVRPQVGTVALPAHDHRWCEMLQAAIAVDAQGFDPATVD